MYLLFVDPCSYFANTIIPSLNTILVSHVKGVDDSYRTWNICEKPMHRLEGRGKWNGARYAIDCHDYLIFGLAQSDSLFCILSLQKNCSHQHNDEKLGITIKLEDSAGGN